MKAALTLFVTLAWPALAAAQATFTAQDREVATESRSDLYLWQQGTNPQTDPATATYNANDDHLTAAPDFAPFAGAVSSTAPPVVGPAVRDGNASASQTSSLAPNGITASGNASMSGDALFYFPGSEVLSAVNALLQPPVPYVFGYLDGEEVGGSSLTVTFELNEPTPYHLVGSLAAGPGNVGFPSVFFSSSALVALSGPSGTVLSQDVFSCDCEEELDYQGVLAPGSYTLTLQASAHGDPSCDPFTLSCVTYATDAAFDVNLSLAGAPVVPGPSRGVVALLGLALAAIGAVALRRA
jgi:hypothetical protein